MPGSASARRCSFFSCSFLTIWARSSSRMSPPATFTIPPVAEAAARCLNPVQCCAYTDGTKLVTVHNPIV